MRKSARHRIVLSLLNMSLRGAALVGRFILSIFLVKFLSLSSVGAFGLLTGLIGVAPAVLGFGMNYYLNREIVDLPIVDSGHKIRDRLGMSILLAVMCIFLLLVVAEMGLVQGIPYPLRFFLILLLEIVAFDLHMIIIAMRMPLLANVIIFIRTAAWTFPYVIVSYLIPTLRSLDVLFDFWLAGLTSALLLWVCRSRWWPWSAIFARPFDWPWLSNHMRRAGLIYCSDLGLVIFQYVDRFILGILLGLTLTGIYTFYWSIANAVQVLVATAVIQVALPKLVSIYREHGVREWMRVIYRELAIVMAITIPLCVALYFFVLFLVPHLSKPQLQEYPLLFPVMLFGVVTRVASDVANFGLYTRGLDRTYALINIMSIFVSIIVGFLAITFGGLMGAGISMAITGITLFAVRAWSINSSYRKDIACHCAQGSEV